MTETGEEIKTEGEAKQSWEIEEERKKALVAMSSDEYDKMMVEKFPGIFADRNKSMTETCMCWGFEVGHGWHALIHDLCVKLDFLCRKLGATVVADQVKEKFGGLRFYYHTGLVGEVSEEDGKLIDGIIQDVISDAENRSDYTCEECGENGDKLTICGWVSTLCSKHAAERREQKAKTLSNCLTHSDVIMGSEKHIPVGGEPKSVSDQPVPDQGVS